MIKVVTTEKRFYFCGRGKEVVITKVYTTMLFDFEKEVVSIKVIT